MTSNRLSQALHARTVAGPGAELLIGQITKITATAGLPRVYTVDGAKPMGALDTGEQGSWTRGTEVVYLEGRLSVILGALVTD